MHRVVPIRGSVAVKSPVSFLSAAKRLKISGGKRILVGFVALLKWVLFQQTVIIIGY